MENSVRLLNFALTLVTILALTVAFDSTVVAEDDGVMTIGSKAPNIDVEHWISDSNGAFEHTTKLDSGKVYVIEFWATWCGPCIAAMPHIAELQKEYSDTVQVISISDEDMDTVDAFLERKVRGNPDMTYGELTQQYCLTTDPDESVKNDYFRAAGRDGIPCAFVVGKTGLVEWIGHPMAMDKPLKEIVNDQWDREKFQASYQKEQKARLEAQEAQKALAEVGQKLQGLMQDGDNEGAVKYIDELLKDDKFKVARTQLEGVKLQLLVTGNLDGAPTALDKFVKDNSDNAQLLNQIAWTVYEQHDSDGNASESLLKSALNAAKVAAEAAPEQGAVLDTYAHLIMAASKDIDKAIEVQKKAVEHAGPQIGEIKPYLDELMKEKESKK